MHAELFLAVTSTIFAIIHLTSAAVAPVSIAMEDPTGLGGSSLPIVTSGIVETAFDPASLSPDSSLFLRPSNINVVLSWSASVPGIALGASLKSAIKWDSAGAIGGVAPVTVSSMPGTLAPVPSGGATGVFANISMACDGDFDAVVNWVVSFTDPSNSSVVFEPVSFAWTWHCVTPGCDAACQEHGTCDVPEATCNCDGRWKGTNCDFILDVPSELCPGDPIPLNWTFSWARTDQEWFDITVTLADVTSSSDWGYFTTGASSGFQTRWLTLRAGAAIWLGVYSQDYELKGSLDLLVKSYEECGLVANTTCTADSQCGGADRGACSNGTCSCTGSNWWADCNHGCSSLETLTDTNGTFSSDRAGTSSFTYVNYANCSWLIDPGIEGDFDEIQITFPVCNIGLGDSLTFYPVLPNGSLGDPLAAFTDTCTPGATAVAKSTKLLAIFLSDYTTSGSGFQVQYGAVKLPRPPTVKIVLAAVLPTLFILAIGMLVVVILWRRSLNKIHNLESQLECKLVSQIMGTPAEHVCKFLLGLQKKRLLNTKDKAELRDCVSIISSNKLFKIELRKKAAERADLDREVDAFLFNTLAQDQSGAITQRSLTKTQSMAGGITKSLKTLDCVEFLRTVDSWNDFDLLKMKQEYENPLETISSLLFYVRGFDETFQIDEARRKRFFQKLESGYNSHPNPYHNSMHAADVSQALHFLLSNIDAAFTETEILAALFAALIHDFRHPGVNTTFLQATFDPIAVRFNFVSVLESMHASEGMMLLLDPENNFLSELSRESFSDFYKTATQLVLATDMSRHAEILAQVSVKLSSQSLDFSNKADRLLALELLLKFSDISNPARNQKMCEYWAGQIREEFFLQGDRELERGLTVSAFMNRRAPDETPKCQIAFVDFIVRPVAELLFKVVPKVEPVISENLRRNVSFWKSKQKKVSGLPVPQVLARTTPSESGVTSVTVSPVSK